MTIDIKKLESRLGYTFNNPELLLLALTHPSCANNGMKTNRRLDFLGDRVLNLVVAAELYSKYPTRVEGDLTKMWAGITNNLTLADHARVLDLGDYLNTGGDAGLSTLGKSLAAVFEAIIGAIYLDGGYAAAHALVAREFQSELTNAPDSVSRFDPKGELQELVQSRSLPAPTYAVISRSGSDNDPSFVCAAMCNGLEIARGTGRSKRAAESMAAANAMRVLLDEGTPAPATAGQPSGEVAANSTGK